MRLIPVPLVGSHDCNRIGALALAIGLLVRGRAVGVDEPAVTHRSSRSYFLFDLLFLTVEDARGFSPVGNAG